MDFKKNGNGVPMRSRPTRTLEPPLLLSRLRGLDIRAFDCGLGTPKTWQRIDAVGEEQNTS